MPRSGPLPKRRRRGLLKGRSARAGGLANQCLEGLGLSDSKIGQDFAVDRDAGALEAADKSAVGQPVLAHGGVDALNPQGAEIPLLQLAADIGVLHRTVDGGIGAGDRVLAAPVEALRLFEDAFSAAVRGDGARSFWHGRAPSARVRHPALDALGFSVGPDAASGELSGLVAGG